MRSGWRLTGPGLYNESSKTPTLEQHRHPEGHSKLMMPTLADDVLEIAVAEIAVPVDAVPVDAMLGAAVAGASPCQNDQNPLSAPLS
jgi:hypothetical protein